MARQYLRSSNGRFARTVQQARAKSLAERRQAKKALSGSNLGGKGKAARSQARTKAKGSKVTTKTARRFASRNRRRFG